MFRSRRRRRFRTHFFKSRWQHLLSDAQKNPIESKAPAPVIPAAPEPLEICLVFDIDGTLTTGLDNGAKLDDLPFIRWFKQNKLAFNIVIPSFPNVQAMPHFLHPGVVELMQYIFCIPFVKVAFFSAGSEIRNFFFVRKLLIRALGKDKYESIKNSITILSNQHLTPASNDQKDSRFKKFQLYSREKYKNLNVLSGLCLDRTLFFEDDPDYIYPGQERNVVFTHFESEAFRKLHGKTHFDLSDLLYILSANHVFYLAGMIKMGLDLGRSDLANNMFKLQFVANGNGTYQPFFQRLGFRECYLAGLTELRKLNPALNFYGEEIIEDYFKGDMILEALKTKLAYTDSEKEIKDSENIDPLCVTMSCLVGSLYSLFKYPTKPTAKESIKVQESPVRSLLLK